MLRPVIAELNKIKNLKCVVQSVKNNIFGKSVTVSGLLAGKDILSSLNGKNKDHDMIALPENLLNREGKFIDNLSLGEFKRRLRPAKVVVGLEALIKNI